MRDTRVKGSPCLNCGKMLNGAMPIASKHRPRAGDITICIECHHLQAFAWDMSLRELTSKEIEDVAGNPTILLGMKVLGELKQTALWKDKHQ